MSRHKVQKSAVGHNAFAQKSNSLKQIRPWTNAYQQPNVQASEQPATSVKPPTTAEWLQDNVLLRAIETRQAELQQQSIQAKLTVGEPGDKYEQEADMMASKVISMSDTAVQRESEEKVQTKPLVEGITPVVQRAAMPTNGGVQAHGNLESRLNSSKGGGSPLGANVRSFMEPRFGADFSQVRVHTDSTAVQMNQELGAQAFAHGSDVYYGEGKAPGNDELTAHELTHVVQQTGTGKQIQRGGVDEDSPDVPADPTLTTLVQAAVDSGNFSIAIYTAVPGVEQEFQRAATSFAQDHQSIGVHNGQLVIGGQAAIAAISTADVVNAVVNTLERVRVLLNRQEIRVDTLALFAHGVNGSGGRSYLNLTDGHQITDAEQTGYGGADAGCTEGSCPVPQQGGSARQMDQLPMTDFVSQVSAALGDRARVVLYACELGDAFYGGENKDLNNQSGSVYENWDRTRQRQAHQSALDDELARGNTSFADELRDLLNETGAHREVWGHRTTGHTTGNPDWRRYGAGTQAGADSLFGEAQATAEMSAEQGWGLHQRNMGLARSVVNQIVRSLQGSRRIDRAALRRLQARSGGLRRWVARELPFAPPPFVEGNPPTVCAAVIEFFEQQTTVHGRAT